MSRNFLVLCLFGISSSFLGVSVAREAILNGPVARVNEFGYQVSLQTQNRVHVCGGGIITSRHILTAAHCVINDNNQFRDDQFLVVAGTNNLQHNTQAHPVDSIFVPTEYRSPVEGSTGDIAVIKLENALVIVANGHLKKLKLGTDNRETYDDKDLLVAGFSWPFRRSEDFDHTLRYSEASVFKHRLCKAYLRGITDNHLCAKLVSTHILNRRKVCTGDGGNPLISNNNTVIGILSRIPDSCVEAANPTVYTRVSHYQHFITATVDGLHSIPGIRTRLVRPLLLDD